VATPWDKPAPKIIRRIDANTVEVERDREYNALRAGRSPRYGRRVEEDLSRLPTPIVVKYDLSGLADDSFTGWFLKILGWVCIIGYLFWYFGASS
jgi:hypothetical protein